MKNKKLIQAMDEFQQLMFKLYNDAEGLRDCAGSGIEKEVFNKTRRALYDLRYEARELYYKWKDQ